jgi:patatin-like phospholipase/acyl hydrolase
MQKVWRILSIDGGGIRGIIPAYILASIEERTGKPISQLFDLIAGTSTGGILALGLTKPNSSGQPEFTAQRLCELYERDIPHIFRNPQSWWGNLLSPKYRSFAFKQVLEKSLGDSCLKDALTDVLVPCYDIEHRSPYIFKSRLAKQNSESNFQMKDVALATSASPTLFYPVRIPRSAGYKPIYLVDGGVFANNPAITALTEIASISPDADKKYFMVSIGTGKSRRPLTNEFISLWGYVHWSRPMLELVTDGISESVHEQMKYLLPSTADHQYYRLQIDLPESINPAIDNASSTNMEALSHAARDFCSDNSEGGKELNRLCKTLLSISNSTIHGDTSQKAGR